MEQDERLALLKEVTGLGDDGLARQLLEKHGGDVHAATLDFLSTAGAGGIELPTTAATAAAASSSSSSSSTVTGVRRRSISPGSERRMRARGAGGAGAGEPALDDSMVTNHALSGAEGGDEAPLLGVRANGAAAPAQATAAATTPQGGAAMALVALPFKLVGLLLRTALAPVRYLAGATEDDGSADPLGTARAFVEGFEREYGAVAGGNNGALRFLPVPFQEATRVAAREQRLLLVYLHAPLHEDTPGFVRGALRSEGMASFLEAADLLCWGGSVQKADACLVGQHLDAAAFPFLALLGCSTATAHPRPQQPQQPQHVQVQVLDHLEGVGRVGVETIVQRLSAALERHQEAVARQMAAQREREERVRLQEEQNREYQEALEADRRREAEVAAERERRAQEEEEARRAEEARAQEAAEAAAARLAALEAKRLRLPPEPELGAGAGAIRLRLQFPHGRKADRRFSPTDTIGVVRDFVDVQVAESGLEGPVNYSLSTPYPKRTFEDAGVTLQEAGLHSADTIYITDLDA